MTGDIRPIDGNGHVPDPAGDHLTLGQVVLDTRMAVAGIEGTLTALARSLARIEARIDRILTRLEET